MTRLAKKICKKLEVCYFMNTKMKIYFVAILISVFTYADLGQAKPNDSSSQRSTEKCFLTVQESPILRGIRLGMTPEEIGKVMGITLKQIPMLTEIVIKKTGSSYQIIMPDTGNKDYPIAENHHKANIGQMGVVLLTSDLKSLPATKKRKFDDVGWIFMDFYLNRLYSFNIVYQPKNIKWSSVYEFASLNSERLKIPLTMWNINKGFGDVKCPEFTVYANLVNFQIELILRNQTVLKQIEEDATTAFIEQDKEKTRRDYEEKKAFKP